MKNLPIAFIAAFFVLAIILNPALAEIEDLPDFEAVDTDQDGMVSRDEASQVPLVANLYNGADLDQDGKLDPIEYDRVKKHLENNS